MHSVLPETNYWHQKQVYKLLSAFFFSKLFNVFQFSSAVLLVTESYVPEEVFEANHPFYFALYKSVQNPVESENESSENENPENVEVLFSGRFTN